jgi:Uma2 family endonuclease
LGRFWAAETGFLLARDPDTVLAPDFSFIAKDRLSYQRTGRGFVPIPPDLVVETRSPSDRLTDMRDKMRRWLSFGVRMALLLDPIQKRVIVYTPDAAEPITLTRDDTLTGGDVLPGFALPLHRLFPEGT